MVEGSPDKSFWKGKTVLVTGSSGFAGRNLSSLLSLLGSNVRCFVISKNDYPENEPGTELVVGDVQDYQSLLGALKGSEVAFHLAPITLIPQTKANIVNTFSTNALGTLNVLLAPTCDDVPDPYV